MSYSLIVSKQDFVLWCILSCCEELINQGNIQITPHSQNADSQPHYHKLEINDQNVPVDKTGFIQFSSLLFSVWFLVFKVKTKC